MPRGFSGRRPEREETVDDREAPYVDVHSHGRSPNPGIRIRDASRGATGGFPPGVYLSVGMHPWQDPALATEAAFTHLALAAAHESVLAIGECGLDRLIATPMAVQSAIFAKQIEIAEGLGKPLIIHCVRAFEELSRIVKSHRPKVPMILHGFNNRVEIARRQLQQGFYLSFGRALLNPGSGACQAFVECPLERKFLETDDSDLEIDTIYAAASRLGEVKLGVLRQSMFDNFQRVFRG
jgi:TatD DNase family protein